MVMLGKIKKSFFLATSVVALASASGAWSETIVVPKGRSQLIDVSEDMTEVIVADPQIADAYVHDKRKVSVMGRALGITDVRILGSDGVLRDITVNVGYDLPAIRKALKDYLPHEDVAVEMLNANLVLSGRVTDAAAAEKAVRIVEEYLSQTPKEQTPKIGSGILNLLEIASGQQVMLRVRVGEMRRSALKRLGLNVQSVKANANSAFTFATGGGIDAFRVGSELGFGQFELPNSTSDVRGFLSARTNGSSGGLSAMLDALERDNLFKILAEPNLVSLSGEESQFLAGGEFPVPVPQFQQVAIEYKPFGVAVKFTPFVLSENRVRIAVEPEVSEINRDNVLQLDGFVVPSLSTRRAQTVVELSPGESFMIAGLIQDTLASSVDSLPGLKEVPILGALFSSVSFKREETELVLAVTPYIVDPLVSSDVKMPTDDFRPASMMEMFFYGAITSLSGDQDRVTQIPTTEGPVGFMVD
ncbi:MAG: type II and III secretion system protein family protein [Alphaproteobacteria bacterium]|nr:MAG: type II and III secretion system protein family protein [Alphaproteobacteria bacterium]TAF14918.1 MAG: type II and III secretion system protein family protein [Alphaproteobacteria bacterium]TAF39382.1 MAG: type II and III secretion system protein family protein [Alphaproteobacteria bacterium]TAF77196.1 MAG: type II and III secretion system protein family protein [Alphaproteobacteria bacterium]